MSPQHLQLTSVSLCSLFRKWYSVKNCEIYFYRWIEMNDNEFWAEFSDSVVQMLCEFGKRKLQSTDNQLTAILLCCLGRKQVLSSLICWYKRIYISVIHKNAINSDVSVFSGWFNLFGSKVNTFLQYMKRLCGLIIGRLDEFVANIHLNSNPEYIKWAIPIHNSCP